MRENAPRAVVVGAGIGGLAAAIGLRRGGWRVLVLERSSRTDELGAGLSLWSNALAALDALGVGGSVRALGSLRGAGGIRTPSGRWLARSSGAALDERSGVTVVLVHRAQLHGALLSALPDIVRTGTAVTGYREDGERALVQCADAGGSREIPADLVVGADGVHSTLRRHLWPDAPEPAHAGITAWRGITDDPFELGDNAGETWGRGGEFGALPLADGRVYWFGTARTPAGITFADEHGEVLHRFGRWHAPIPELIRATSPESVLHHDIEHLPRPLPAFRRGRAALLGDAAHAMTPHLGQGACAALEDAAVLAATTAPGAVTEGLARYDRLRRPRTEHLVAASARVGRVIQLRSRPAATARDLLVRAAPERLATASIARLVDWRPPEIAPPQH